MNLFLLLFLVARFTDKDIRDPVYVGAGKQTSLDLTA